MNLLKQSVVYLFLTCGVVYFAAPMQLGIVYIDMLFTYTNVVLAEFFTNHWLAKTITLMVLPLGLSYCPAGLYWLIKRKKMPYIAELTWLLWLVFITSNALIR